MTGFRKIFGTVIITALLFVLGWTWFIVKRSLELIGFSTIIEDAANAQRLSVLGLKWILSTPWWVPFLIAISATVLITYLIWQCEKYWNSAHTHTTKAEEAYQFYIRLRRAVKLRSMLVQVTAIISNLIDHARPLSWQAQPHFDNFTIEQIASVVESHHMQLVQLFRDNDEAHLLTEEMLIITDVSKPFFDEHRYSIPEDQKFHRRKIEHRRNQCWRIQQALEQEACDEATKNFLGRFSPQ